MKPEEDKKQTPFNFSFLGSANKEGASLFAKPTNGESGSLFGNANGSAGSLFGGKFLFGT